MTCGKPELLEAQNVTPDSEISGTPLAVERYFELHLEFFRSHLFIFPQQGIMVGVLQILLHGVARSEVVKLELRCHDPNGVLLRILVAIGAQEGTVHKCHNYWRTRLRVSFRRSCSGTVSLDPEVECSNVTAMRMQCDIRREGRRVCERAVDRYSGTGS